MDNLINLTDSYKFSHFNQYPKGTEIIHSHLIARGGEYDKIVFFGLKYYVERYLRRSFEEMKRRYVNGYSDTIETKNLTENHGIPFNKNGWDYIIQNSFTESKLPINIKAFPEETVVKIGEPLMTIENTDPKCAWLVGWLETLLLKVWYPTTIATKSYHIKKNDGKILRTNKR